MKKKLTISAFILLAFMVLGTTRYFTKYSTYLTSKENKNAPAYYNEMSDSEIKLEWNRNGNTYNINIHYVYPDGTPLLTTEELNNISNNNPERLPTIDGTNLYLDHMWSVAKEDNEYYFYKVMYGSDFNSARRIKLDLYSYGGGDKSNRVFCNEVTDTEGNLTNLWNLSTEIEMDHNSDVWIVYEPRFEIENDTYVVNWEVYNNKIYKIRFHFVDLDGNNIADKTELEKIIKDEIGYAGRYLPVRQYTDLYMDKAIFSTSLNDYNLSYIAFGNYSTGQRIKKDIYAYSYQTNASKSDKLYYNKVDDVYTGQWDVQTEEEMPLESDIYLVYEPINYLDDNGVYHVKMNVNGTTSYNVNIHYVDKNMNPLIRDEKSLEYYPRVIGVSNIFLNQQREIKVGGEDYVFSRTIYDDQVIKPVIYYRYNNNDNLFYNTYSGNSGREIYNVDTEVAFPNNDVDIYLVYGKEYSTLPTVATIDNNKYNFTLKIADFTEADLDVIGGPSWHEAEGKATEGLFSKFLDDNGFPVAVINNVNLGDIYAGKTTYDATNLFLKSYFDNPNTKNVLHYSSAENFASFNTETGKFTVFDVLGTATDEDHFFYSRGLFMPFNTLDKTKIINYNWYDYENNKIEDESYSNDIFGYKEENNYHFGLYGEARFRQEDGGLFNGNAATITLGGDDDLLLYIDGVLVGDLGGIHDAQMLSVNFQTGVIEWTTNKTNSAGSKEQTTFAEIFDSLDPDKQEELAKIGWNSNGTILDDTEHELKVFYFERGYSAADLQLEFAIPLIYEEPIDEEPIDDEPIDDEPIDDEPVIDNPSTGDKIFDYISMFGISMTGLAGAIILAKKNNKKLSYSVVDTDK